MNDSEYRLNEHSEHINSETDYDMCFIENPVTNELRK